MDRTGKSERSVKARRQRELCSNLAEVDVGWLAGLLEGEGYFGLVPNKSGGKTYHYARLGVTMTDSDGVERGGHNSSIRASRSSGRLVAVASPSSELLCSGNEQW